MADVVAELIRTFLRDGLSQDLWRSFEKLRRNRLPSSGLHLFPLCVGTKLLRETQKHPSDQAVDWLKKSLELQYSGQAAYNLAWCFDMRIRQDRRRKETEGAEMFSLYHENKTEPKAACQLGSYLMDFPEDAQLFGLQESPFAKAEELLLRAESLGVSKATVNLIRLYEKFNKTGKLIPILIRVYLQNRDEALFERICSMILDMDDYEALLDLRKTLRSQFFALMQHIANVK